MLEREGEEWTDAWGEQSRPLYTEALTTSTATFVATSDDIICGFVRCIGNMTIYVDDLLIDKEYRGRGIGRQLMESVCREFPDKEVYVLSDVDEYYTKLGYENAGTVFKVRIK